MYALLWSLSALAGPCAEPISTAVLAERAMGAFDALQQSADQTAVATGEQLDRDLACVEGPLSPEAIARVHRYHALVAHRQGNPRGVLTALAAAAVAAPDLEDLGLPDAPDALAQALALAAPAQVAFGTSLAAEVYVDGQIAASRPVGRPVVLQAFSPDGHIVGTQWIAASQPLPEWVAFPPIECLEAIDADVLVQHVGRAEAAYGSLDVPAFEGALHSLALGLPCTRGTVALSQAAAIHRLEGLRQYTHDNPSQAIRSFQSSQMLDPGYTPSEAVVPPGSSLAELWDRAHFQSSVAWVAVDLPPDLLLFVDGIRSRQRPAALPSIVQLSSASGIVVWSRYVPPGGGLPDLERFATEARDAEIALLPPALALYREEGLARKRRGLREGMWVSGAVVLGASALTFAANTAAAYQYYNGDWNVEKLERYRNETNVTGAISTSLFVGGTSLIVAGFAVTPESKR